MAELQAGARAPDFDFPDGIGHAKLSALRGRPVVIFFYPRADSPACTSEVVGFSERLDDFEMLGASVIGISPDTPAKLDRWRNKHSVRVPLVSDVDLKIVGKWGVWVEKSMYGRAFMGVERATFLLDSKGNVASAWHRVRVAGHAEAVLGAVRAMREGN